MMTKNKQSIQSELHDEMLKIALRDFDEFCMITQFDITRAYICMLKAKGKSYAQIGVCLGKSRSAVIGIYKRNCVCIQPQKKSKR